jgi:hypothetical protein
MAPMLAVVSRTCSFAPLVAALCIVASDALAGAWTLPEGDGQAIVTGTFSAAPRGYDGGGNAVDIPDYEKFEAQALIEYGVTDWLTAVVQPQLQRVEIAAPTDATRTGLGYTDLGARFRLWAGDYGVVSTQVLGRIPGARDETDPAQIGHTDPELDLRLSSRTRLCDRRLAVLRGRAGRLPAALRRSGGRSPRRSHLRHPAAPTSPPPRAILQRRLGRHGEGRLRERPLFQAASERRVEPHGGLVVAGRRRGHRRRKGCAAGTRRSCRRLATLLKPTPSAATASRGNAKPRTFTASRVPQPRSRPLPSPIRGFLRPRESRRPRGPRRPEPISAAAHAPGLRPPR